MTRGIAANIKTELDKSSAIRIMFIQMEWDSGTVRLCSYSGNLTTAAGRTFTGIGDLGDISEIHESWQLQATSVKFSLTGIPATYLSIVLNEDTQGRPVQIEEGFLNTSTYVLVSEPHIIWKGFMDKVEIVENGKTADVSIEAESALATLNQPNERHLGTLDQQLRFPNDRGLEFVHSLAEERLLWK